MLRDFSPCLLVLLGFAPSIVTGQEPIPYGPPITLAQAKKVMAAAETEAVKQNWPVAIAIVDAGGASGPVPAAGEHAVGQYRRGVG